MSSSPICRQCQNWPGWPGQLTSPRFRINRQPINLNSSVKSDKKEHVMAESCYNAMLGRIKVRLKFAESLLVIFIDRSVSLNWLLWTHFLQFGEREQERFELVQVELSNTRQHWELQFILRSVVYKFSTIALDEFEVSPWALFVSWPCLAMTNSVSVQASSVQEPNKHQR